MLELDSKSVLLVYLRARFLLSISFNIPAVSLNPGCMLKSPRELLNNNYACVLPLDMFSLEWVG